MAALKAIAPRYGFGYADMKRPKAEAHGGALAAVYTGKYVGKAVKEEVTVRRPLYVGAFLTRRTGVTMRACRWRRYIFMRFGFRPTDEELRPLMDLLAAFPGLEIDRLPSDPRGPPVSVTA